MGVSTSRKPSYEPTDFQNQFELTSDTTRIKSRQGQLHMKEGAKHYKKTVLSSVSTKPRVRHSKTSFEGHVSISRQTGVTVEY